ncbi:hypothetical protein CRG98_016727 [Punica granatum]|uniref:Uncharacterized protein n=1 Tax=Punica granatum TaxID=22663 RepID=A0A2I0K423_PUNGR|nr:hypothetical protein CRG98_016727 [Punica granatum]
MHKITTHRQQIGAFKPRQHFNSPVVSFGRNNRREQQLPAKWSGGLDADLVAVSGKIIAGMLHRSFDFSLEPV